MSAAIIRKGFETRLKTWADAQTPAIPIAWANVPFTPPVGRYIRAFTLPASTDRISLDGVCKEWKGIYQASFCMPIGTGAGAVETLMASLDAAFEVSFTQDGLRIFMLSPFHASPALEEPDRYVVPVWASYQVNTV